MSMLDYIIDGADGKSGLVTLETLPNDIAKVTPTIKIIFYTLVIGFISGYARMSLIGFHPLLQGTLLGLLLGTMCGKTLAIPGQVPKNRKLLPVFAITIGLVAIGCHYFAMGLAIPNDNTSFLKLAWLENDMREIPQILPFIGIGSVGEPVNRITWLVFSIVDILVFLLILVFSFSQAIHAHKPSKKANSGWQVYRMLLLVLALYGSAFFTQKDEFKPNRTKLVSWIDEVYAHHFVSLTYENIDGLPLDKQDPKRIALESILEEGKAMERHFPEGHYLTAIDQLRNRNFYFARDELDRAIFEAEQMTRRTWTQDGSPVHRDILLAQLYQLRAKLNLEKENYLAAERDLTVAIYIHQDLWLKTPETLNQGLFRHEADMLRSAGYNPAFGFAACHFERHLARLHLDKEQAAKDLEEAHSLGYPSHR